MIPIIILYMYIIMYKKIIEVKMSKNQ